MNILDENGESYFVTAFDHSTQEQGTATSKDAFTGGDINASLTQEVVELRKEVIGHGTDQLLYLAGKDGGLVSDDLVDIAVFQDPGIERITLACDTVVEGNDTLLEALYHRQIRMAAAQLQDIDGKAANVNDIGDGMSFLPPAHYEQLHSRFEQYFLRRREIVDFEYNGKYYSIRLCSCS